MTLHLCLCMMLAFRKPHYGKASWYGKRFNGRIMANGKPFNPYRMTAASRTIPLGTWIRVTNLHNRLSVIVQITDRGPFIKGRILDLSEKAAKVIGCKRVGICNIKYEIVRR